MLCNNNQFESDKNSVPQSQHHPKQNQWPDHAGGNRPFCITEGVVHHIHNLDPSSSQSSVGEVYHVENYTSKLYVRIMQSGGLLATEVLIEVAHIIC